MPTTLAQFQLTRGSLHNGTGRQRQMMTRDVTIPLSISNFVRSCRSWHSEYTQHHQPIWTNKLAPGIGSKPCPHRGNTRKPERKSTTGAARHPINSLRRAPSRRT